MVIVNGPLLLLLRMVAWKRAVVLLRSTDSTGRLQEKEEPYYCYPWSSNGCLSTMTTITIADLDHLLLERRHSSPANTGKRRAKGSKQDQDRTRTRSGGRSGELRGAIMAMAVFSQEKPEDENPHPRSYLPTYLPPTRRHVTHHIDQDSSKTTWTSPV